MGKQLVNFITCGCESIYIYVNLVLYWFVTINNSFGCTKYESIIYILSLFSITNTENQEYRKYNTLEQTKNITEINKQTCKNIAFQFKF